MKSRLFTLFAPITVPCYVAFLALANLLGGAYYIVVEASLARILGRPISLTPRQLLIFSLPVLAIAPFVLIIHLLIAAAMAFVGFLRWVGRWQADVQGKWTAIIPGLAWTLVAFWVSLTCFNASWGVALIGRGIPQENVDRLVEFGTRNRMLGAMPLEMQRQREALIAAFDDYKAEASAGAMDSFEYREWELRTELLRDSDTFASWFVDRRSRDSMGLPAMLTLQRLADVPWFYYPSDFSADGLDRSVLLLGPLLFAWLVLFRWPGTFVVFSRTWQRALWLIVRLAGVTWAIFWLVTWEPMSPIKGYVFLSEAGKLANPPFWFAALSPAHWLGVNYLTWARPEWWLFNAGLWCALLGVVAFVWWLGWRLSSYLSAPRYYVAFLASRLLQRKRIAFFSVGAVTLCVAMMIIVKSVMGGFVDSIRERANGLLGHLVIGGSMQGFPHYDEILTDLKELRDPKTGKPVVKTATPVIHTYGVIQFPRTNETFAVEIKGVRLQEYIQVNAFGEGLFYNQHYGSTSLSEERGRPAYGFGENGLISLPGDMDRYYFNEYLPSLPEEERREVEKRFKRNRGESFFPGPGSFIATDAKDFAPEFQGKPFPGIILGSDLTLDRLSSGEYDRDAGYALGEEVFVTMLTLTRTGDTMNEPPPKVLFRYVDDSRTGIHEVDSKQVYLDFDIVQKLLLMGPAERVEGTMASARCSQILIRLHDEFAATDAGLREAKDLVNEVCQRVRERADSDEIESRLMRHVGASTYIEMQSSFVAAIQKEEVLVLIMFGVISLVAIFLILCIFYMIVQEKTRDVGIIKSVGGSTEGIAAVFLVYAAAIGLVGCILGSIMGTTFVTYINDVQDFLARISPELRIWNPETYSFDQIPSQWKMSEVLWISALAIVASVLGATIPAIKAGRTWPVESLRYE